MTHEIETAEAVAALRAAVKECQDVLDLADVAPDETLEGRGYKAVTDVMGDMVRIINNGLRRLGEAPVLPAPPEPDPATQSQLENTLEELERAKAQLAGTQEADEGPDVPVEVAELLRENEAYGEAQQRLQAEYNDLTNLIMQNAATPQQMRKQQRLHGAIAWLKRSAVEIV